MGIWGSKKKSKKGRNEEAKSSGKERKKYTLKVSIAKRDLKDALKVKNYIERVAKDYIKLKNGEYVKLFLPRVYPSSIPLGFINFFIHTEYPTTINIFLKRYRDEEALAKIQRNLTVIKGEKYYYEKLGLVSSEKYAQLVREEKLTEDLRNLILGKETHLYDLIFTVGVRGENFEEAKEHSKRIGIAFKGLNFKLHKGYYRMWEIFRTFLPIAKQDIPYYNPMQIHTDVATAFFPFTSGMFSLFGDNAILYGFNEVNNTPVFIDRFLGNSYNGLIFGKTGSGKSYFAKLSMVRSSIANPDILIYSLDPMGEYRRLVEAMGGLNVKLWNPSGVGSIINPLDPRINENEFTRVKNIVALFSTIFELTAEEMVFLDGVLHKLYKKFEGSEPVLGDLIELVYEQIEVIKRVEGESSAMRYERLVNLMRIFEDGSLSFLNRPSNVDITGYNYVNFDLSGTPDDFIPFFMFYVSNYVYSKLKNVKDRYKLFYIDEVSHIWRFPLCAESLEWMVRQSRHYKAGLIMLTQSVNDGFLNSSTRAIMENTEMHLLMHHDNLTDEVRNFYKLTPEQESYIYAAHGGKGYGHSTALLVFGIMKIPIKIYASPEEHEFLVT